MGWNGLECIFFWNVENARVQTPPPNVEFSTFFFFDGFPKQRTLTLNPKLIIFNMWKQSYQLCKKGKLSESMDVKIEEPWLQPFYTLTQPAIPGAR